jgi:Cu(I)/Ag(I) efflux system protein CusF
MKYIQQILIVISVAGSLLFSVASVAQTSQQTDSLKTEAAYTDGEVKRIDMSSGKITIKHGFIKSLDMPPMTMVFTVKEKALLNDIAVGDQVRFIVISDNGKMVITEILK